MSDDSIRGTATPQRKPLATIHAVRWRHYGEAWLQQMEAQEHDEPAGELECPCCGYVAARGEMWDGDALLCGCAGIVSVDRETPPYVSMSEDPCQPSARCHDDISAPEHGAPAGVVKT